MPPLDFISSGRSVRKRLPLEKFVRLTMQSANVPNGTPPIVHSQFRAIVHAH